MTTVVMNTLNAAVTEYDWSFQSITPTHAGDAAGLYLLGGDTDNAGSLAPTPIAATVTTGITNWGTSLKKTPEAAFLALRGAGGGLFHVHCPGVSYAYPVVVQADGQTRANPGLGIKQAYLGFGYSNVAGADFHLDRIEIPLVESDSRRS